MAETFENDIDDRSVIREFIVAARNGIYSKEEIVEKHHLVEEKVAKLSSKLIIFKRMLQRWDSVCDTKEIDSLEKNYGTKDEIRDKCKELEKERIIWDRYLVELKSFMNDSKNFNKKLCFSNIRELLRQNPDVKIGQIEKEAGIRLGYMSRLEKDGNTSEPSIEFIVTAAKLLKVSIDTLVSVDITGLTPTEQYLVKFFDKLKADTLNDKLDWNRETAFNLNRMERNFDGSIYHPLFEEETFYEESGCEYPEEVTRIVFNSKTFGPRTHINDDCFNLKMKNGTILYFMDIEKSVHKVNDQSAYAKEAWMYVPYRGSQLLVASQDNTSIAPLFDALFDTVKERMEHPKINKEVMDAIDSFMENDISDDDDCVELPFS